MNIALPRTSTGRKASALAIVVAGTALGIAAGVGIWEISDSGSGSARAGIGTLARSYEAISRDDRTLMLYLVDSQQQADMVYAAEQEAARERESASAPDPNYVLSVMMVVTPEDEQSVRELLEVWANEPGGVRLSDLRTH